MNRARLITALAVCLLLALGCSDDGGTSTQQDTGGGGKKDGGGTKKDTGGGKQDTGGGKQDTGGTLPSGLKFCARSCKAVNDCCDKPPCDKGAAAMTCDQGTCIYVGCKSVADCPKLPPQVKTKMACKKYTMLKRTIGICMATCAGDGDCGAPTKCLTMKVSGISFKTCLLPCAKDADCLVPSLKCIDNKYCSVPTSATHKCTADKDCGGKFFPGHDKCDVASGYCTCDDNKKCQDANKASPGTYKCAKYF